MARDKIGSLKWTTPEEVTKGLESWLLDYISADSNPDENSKARYPLRAAKVEVKEDPNKPGAYQAVAWLQPWLPMQQLTTSLRMVARLPQKAG
jgi:type VI secretion system protein ImpC